MAEVILPRPRAAEHSTVKSLSTKAAVAVAATALVALCAHLSLPLPFTPVPLSLAPLAVLFLGLVLGPRLAFASLFLYLAEGAAGLPVFSPQGPGGVLQLLGPTGGYLLSYPFAAALAGFLYSRAPRSFFRGLLGAGAGSLVILLSGASWLRLLTHMDLNLIFAQAVAPFLPGDLLKVGLAASAAKLTGTLRRNDRKSTSSASDENR